NPCRSSEPSKPLTAPGRPESRRRQPCIRAFALGLMLFLTAEVVHAVPPVGGSNPWLDYWSFGNTNWLTDLGYAPLSFTNLSSSNLGDGSAVVVDSTNAAWLIYNVTEADNTNNLTVDVGSIIFWFMPSWSGSNSGGVGPGQWGRFIEAGSYTTNASYGVFSLY